MQDAIQVGKRRQLRLFIQPGGPKKGNPVDYFGVGRSYAEITSVSNPRRSDPEPIDVFDPLNANGFQTVGETINPAGFPKYTLKLTEAAIGTPQADRLGNCAFNAYEIRGNECGDLSDHLRGWRNGYVRIYGGSTVGTADLGDRTSLRTDGELGHTFPLTAKRIYSKGSLNCGAVDNPTLSDKLVTDVVYATKLVCDSCGAGNDGTRVRYACTAAPTSSPGGRPYVGYTLDGGKNWTWVQVSSAAVAEDLICIRILGHRLVVLSRTGGGSSTSAMHHTTLSRRGIPGSWTKVTTGFLAGSPANDMLVLSPAEAYLCGDNGTIYLCRDASAGVTIMATGLDSGATLSRIKGNWNQLVAVGVVPGFGGNPSIVRSLNKGDQWGVAESIPSFRPFLSVEVLNNETLWVGDDNGGIFVSYDGGESWEQAVFNGWEDGGGVSDINASTPDCLSFLYNSPTGAKLFHSFTGGESFDSAAPLNEGFGSYEALNRIATPQVGGTWTDYANSATFVGTNSGTEGVVVTGAAYFV